MQTLLKPLHIGKYTIDAPVLLAPMSGITDAPFRRLVAEMGCGYVVSEMVPSEELARGQAVARLRAEGNGLGLHIVQLAGCSPDVMAEGAKAAVQSGAHIVDINMGCPAKRVTGGYAGSSLMRDEKLALALIEATVNAVDVPVTLKMRLGWDEASFNAPIIAKAAESLGVQMIVVHGRTRQQFYKGVANWAKIAQVKQQITIPVICNGDIVDLETSNLALAQSNTDGVMIGRGIEGRPWLLKQIGDALTGKPVAPSPNLAQQYAIISRLYAAELTHYGVRIGYKHARKHLGWALDVASNDIDWQAKWRLKILTSEEPAHVHGYLSDAYDDLMQRKAAA